MDNFLDKRLLQRKRDSSLRTLKIRTGLTDFSSNDYLGFARSEFIKRQVYNYTHKSSGIFSGSTGSRLLSGNSQLAEDLEKLIADFHSAESSLLFNSGYDANLGLLSSVPQKGDTIICDELVHASIIDGIRLSNANKFNFRHNDITSLENKLKHASGNIFIVTESVFSMDGDQAPLIEITELAAQYNAYLIIDEAHAVGVFGNKGKGLVCQLKLESKVFARIVTFGKALGCHGAAVLGSEKLKTYLINFARSFIYTTALPPHSLINIKIAYQQLSSGNYPEEISKTITLFKSLTKNIRENFIDSNSAIQCIIVSGNKNCKLASEKLADKGFDVRPILHPTVPEGKERLRICLHIFNTEREIASLCTGLNSLF